MRISKTVFDLPDGAKRMTLACAKLLRTVFARNRRQSLLRGCLPCGRQIRTKRARLARPRVARRSISLVEGEQNASQRSGAHTAECFCVQNLYFSLSRRGSYTVPTLFSVYSNCSSSRISAVGVLRKIAFRHPASRRRLRAPRMSGQTLALSNPDRVPLPPPQGSTAV